ncbi:leucine carboxyl methyltransferase [Armillaria luteobubalina]|uniref:Leucine carboxyl methyltransferase 1 n=1 Tax=Armillaria luteobubalina TaxID=153913 RepID=A0AA39Q8E2_9AGAR|nr:leucine carboxyl methyltransferase [Armillaria luteobubalina]
MFPPPSADADASIRSTDSDAALAKLSAVQKQYLSDPYIQYFVPRARLQPARPPLINIGTYVRTAAIDDLINQWLSLSHDEGKQCQIVSLGAGSDTRYWRIAEAGPQKDALSTYIEIDFPEITSKKAMAIRKSKQLSAVLGNPADVKVSGGGTALHASKYHLLSADLRLSPQEILCPLLTQGSEPLLSPSLPTLLLFECVLVYMSPSASSSLLKWFLHYFSQSGNNGFLGTIVYEMFGLQDSFGRVMVDNLKARNVSLPGAVPYSTVETLPARFTGIGYTAARALTLRDIRIQYISRAELNRVSTLEFLDEVEELDLVLNHYAITWGLWHPGTETKASWGMWGLKTQLSPGNT